MAKWKSAGNLIGTTPSRDYERTYTSSLKYQPEPEIQPPSLGNSTDELFFPIQSQTSTKDTRRPRGDSEKTKSRTTTAKKKKTSKKERSWGGKRDETAAPGGTPIERTSSLPTFPDERDTISVSAAGGCSNGGGSLTILMESANLPDQNKTMQVAHQETARDIIKRILASYGHTQHVDSYCLEQVNTPISRGDNLPYSVPPHRYLRPDERPLQLVRSLQSRFPSIRTLIHLTFHQDDSLSLEAASSKEQDYVNIRNRPLPIPQLLEVNPNGSAKTGRALKFRLVGVLQPEKDKVRGGTPIKVGSQFAAVGPPPNIALSADRFPDIRPVHCSLLPASTGAPADASNGGGGVLISPALDITARPPGPTLVCIDGKKVVRPTMLRQGAIVQLGRSLFLKYVVDEDKAAPHAGTNAVSGHAYAKARSPDRQYQSRSSLNQPTYENAQHLLPDRIPIVVDVCIPEAKYRTNRSKDDFAALLHETCCDTVDAILEVARSLSNHATAPIGESRSNQRVARPTLFVLTPAFLIYALLRGCIRRWQIVQLTQEQKDHYLSGLINHIVNQLFQCIQTALKNDGTNSFTVRGSINQQLFWLANSSELLNFINNDADLSSCTTPDALLNRCIGAAFDELRTSFIDYIRHLAPSILFPGDFDQQDDLRLDNRPAPLPEKFPPNQEDPNIQHLIQSLSYMMLGMRQACVNVSFALQLFTHVFHTLSAWIFNSILGEKVGKAPKSSRSASGLWLTKLGAGRLMRRLQRLKQWADRHGLENACDVHLRLPLEVCQMITADRTKFQAFQRRILELRSLNSAKVEWILTHLGDPPPVPQEWVHNIVKRVRQSIDREIIDKNGSPSSKETRELLSITEPVELTIPLIIPPEGYASGTGITGIPEGFMEAVEPLIEDGCITVSQNEAAIKPPLNGSWTGYFGSHQNTMQAARVELPQKGGVKEKQKKEKRRSTTMPTASLKVEALAREAGVRTNSVQQINLIKNGNALGMGIVAAKPDGRAPYGIYVRQIVAGGVAALDGRLERGDQLLAIGQSSLVGCDQSEAAVAILSRLPDTVPLLVAKRAAQARGILALINGAVSAAPPPQESPPLRGALVRRPRNGQSTQMTSSTPCLSMAASGRSQMESDDDDDDDVPDDSESSGPRFGSRTQLATGKPSNGKNRPNGQQIHRPKSLEILSTTKAPTYQRPNFVSNNRTRLSSGEDDEEVEEDQSDGSDEIWRPNESIETIHSASRPNGHVARPTALSGSHSTHQSPASVQGSLDDYKFRSQQDLRVLGAARNGDQASQQKLDRAASPDWDEYARRNAEVLKNGDVDGELLSPSLESITSPEDDNESIISREAAKKLSSMSPRMPEKRKTASSPRTTTTTTTTSGLGTEVKSRETSTTNAGDGRVAVAALQPTAVEPPKKTVSDKSMQTMHDSVIKSPNREAPSQSAQTATVFQASGVQTDPLPQLQQQPKTPQGLGNTFVATGSTVVSPSNLPTIDSLSKGPLVASKGLPTNLPCALLPIVHVEDVTKAPVVNVNRGRYTSPAPRNTTTSESADSSCVASADLRLPWGVPYPTPKPLSSTGVSQSHLRSRTIQSGVTYWRSSQNNLDQEVPTPTRRGSPSPPPKPTADFPQYHPPEYLEPSDLAISFGVASSPTVAFAPPATRYVASTNASRHVDVTDADLSPQQRSDLLMERSRSLSSGYQSSSAVRAGSLNRVLCAHPANQSEQLQHLAREIRLLEEAISANPKAELVRELDRLRVEYRFQLQLNERTRSRSLNVPYVGSSGGSRIAEASPMPAISPPVQSKPTKIRPLAPNLPQGNDQYSSSVLDDLHRQRLEIVRNQEHRARLYADSLSIKHSVDLKSPGNANVSITSRAAVPPLQPHYTYQLDSGPLYENREEVQRAQTRTRTPVTARQTPGGSSRDSSLARGNDLRGSRKSVTFDTNLESVAVYSPLGTPRGNQSEDINPGDAVARYGNLPTGVGNFPINISRQNRFAQSSPEADRNRQISPPHRAGLSTMHQPENAENLSFKDKMAFFAHAIGEEMPKDRQKVSQKELQILQTLAR